MKSCIVIKYFTDENIIDNQYTNGGMNFIYNQLLSEQVLPDIL